MTGPLFARFVVIVPNINIFWSFKKHLWKKERSWSLAERFFKQNYCHACQVCRILSSPVHWWRQRMWGQQILNGARVATEVVSLALSNYLAFVTSWHKTGDPFAQTNRQKLLEKDKMIFLLWRHTVCTIYKIAKRAHGIILCPFSSLRKHPFLLTLLRAKRPQWRRARRKGCFRRLPFSQSRLFTDSQTEARGTHRHHIWLYSRLPISRTFKGNQKKFELSGARRK